MFCYCRYDLLTAEELQVLEAHYGYPAYHPKTYKVSAAGPPFNPPYNPPYIMFSIPNPCP